MFEEATWTTRNRRIFAITEALFEHVDLPVNTTDSWDMSDNNEFAAALVFNVGVPLLDGSISAGMSKSGKFSNRKEKTAWKQIEPGAGLRAAVFLTTGTAAMLTGELDLPGEPEIDETPIVYGRTLVDLAFTPPPTDFMNTILGIQQRAVEEMNSDLTKMAIENGGLAPSFIVQQAQAALSFHALEFAGADPRNMPAFEPVRDVDPLNWNQERGFDWMLAFSVAFGEFWKHTKDTYLNICFTPFMPAEEPDPSANV